LKVFKDRGESDDSEEDFFASSPTANLAGDNEEGQKYDRFFDGLRQVHDFAAFLFF
jgi:hypothetical protein